MDTPKQIELRKRAETNGEAGFLLVYVVLLVALVLIAMAVAAPVVAKDLQRDKEVEAQHRANEYVRAIRLYHKKFQTYPPSMDALENTNNVRYLRKQYIDPLTGKADWRIIHVGENKTTVKGFFGEPLGGLNTTGAGGGGLGSASTMGTGFGGATSGNGGAAGPTGTTLGSSSGSTTVSGGSALAGGFQGATIGGSSTPGSSSSSSTSSSSSGPGSIGQIMGVGTSKTGQSILNPNQQTSYETWEFIYDPKIELLYQQANIFGGGTTGGVNSQSLSNTGSDAVSGQSNSKGGATNTPSTPTPPSTNPFPQ